MSVVHGPGRNAKQTGHGEKTGKHDERHLDIIRKQSAADTRQHAHPQHSHRNMISQTLAVEINLTRVQNRGHRNDGESRDAVTDVIVNKPNPIM